MMHRYLKLLDEEIEAAVRAEVEREELDGEVEHNLHCLLENRKHIQAWIAEHTGRPVSV